MKTFIALAFFLAPIFAKAIDTRQASANTPPNTVNLRFSYPESKNGQPYPRVIQIPVDGLYHPVGGDHLTSNVERTSGEGTTCEVWGPTSPSGANGTMKTLTDIKNQVPIDYKGAPVESRILSVKCYKAPKMA